MVSNHNLHVDQTLPFELKALEAALAAGMKLLDIETGALEGRLQPSLDRLSVRVSRGHDVATQAVHLMHAVLCLRRPVTMPGQLPWLLGQAAEKDMGGVWGKLQPSLERMAVRMRGIRARLCRSGFPLRGTPGKEGGQVLHAETRAQERHLQPLLDRLRTSGTDGERGVRPPQGSRLSGGQCTTRAL